MPTWLRQLRVIARNLLRQPSYSLLVVAMLALGVAGNSAIFSLVHSLLLEPLAFDEPERLVYLDETAPKWNLELVGIAYSDFHAWREHNRTFDSLALVRDRAFNLVADGTAERIEGALVTHDLPRVLRVRPLLGRGFTAQEDRSGGPKVAILSHALWHRRFGADPAIVGRAMRLDGALHEIVGVLPPGLKYPAGAELWVPAARDPVEDYGSYQFKGIGRLLAGVSPARAKEDLDANLQELIAAYPWKAPVSSVVKPLRDHFVEDSRTIASVLMAAVALVLVIACVNIASLMLARSAARRREIGVRLALGAGRGRIMQQLLSESLVLALAGAAAGVGLGYLGLRSLGAMAADQLPFWVSFEPRAQALVLCVGACVATVLAFGLVPAWQTARIDLQGTLHGSAARAGASRGQRRTLSGLVVAEMALAQMLLVGAALMALSQRAVLSVDPGFRTENVLTFQLALPEASYETDAATYAFFDQLVARLSALPGVESAAAITNAPLQGHSGRFFKAEGAVEDPDAQTPVVLTRLASEGYLETLGIELLRGRAQRVAGVGEEAPREVVVNETFARLYWGEGDPIGQRIRHNDNPWLTVVGLARDVRHYGLDQDPRPGVYLPLGSMGRPGMTLAVHTAVEPTAVVEPARRLVREMDPELPLYRVATMEQELRRSLTLRRLTAWLFGLFAAVALVLACGGSYGVVSYAVHQRRREIGVRVALGARFAQVLRGVLGRGMSLALGGVVLGVAAAWALSQSLAALLFGVEARDPKIFAGVALALVAVALAANAVPAHRAARLDPMRVLREE